MTHLRIGSCRIPLNFKAAVEEADSNIAQTPPTPPGVWDQGGYNDDPEPLAPGSSPCGAGRPPCEASPTHLHVIQGGQR